jgi:hypothetical protein
MKKIMTYSVFENSKKGFSPGEQINYFEKILRETQEGRDFSKWFYVKPVRTGRFYVSKKNEIKGINIPSRSYFDFGHQWYYEFSSSNGIYGTTKNQDLKSLFRIFMIDAVKKSRASSISQKQIEEFFSKESNAPVGNFPLPEKIYQKIESDSGFIQDFKFILDLEIAKKCKDLGIIIKNKIDGRKEGISISFEPGPIIKSIVGEKEKVAMDEIASKLELHKIYLNFTFLTLGELNLVIIPKTTKGKSVNKARDRKVIKIGTDNKDSLEKIVEDSIKDPIDLHPFRFSPRWGYTTIKPLKMINDYLKSQLFGSGSIKKEEVKEYIEKEFMESVGSYFEENPLDLYLLDDFPKIKKEIIEKYGIPDVSKFGKAFKTGWFGEN